MFGSSFTLLSSTKLNRYLSLPLTSVNSVLSALKSPCSPATYRPRHSTARRLFAFSIFNLELSTFISFRLHVPNPIRICSSRKHTRKPFRMRSFKTRHLKGDYVFDTDACYSREIVAGECLVGILRTGRPCYHSCEMKVEKRKFDQALKKMLRAKPEPRKKIRTRGRRGPKTPILAKP
jgi:hypothetical protein